MRKRKSGMIAESVPVLKRVGHRKLRVPGSKSLTQRAIMLGAIGAGRTVLSAPLFCDDTERLTIALSKLCVGVKWSPNKLVLHGLDGKFSQGGSVNLGAGGTPSRFMIAASCLAADDIVVDGDARMRIRPVGELLHLLEQLGASFDGDHLPVTVSGGTIKGGKILDVPVTKSSQFISALLLVAPFLEGGLTLRCQKPMTSRSYVALTLEMLRTFGVTPLVEETNTSTTIGIQQTRVTHREVEIEPDASSAIYFAAIASMHEGLSVTLEGFKSTSKQPDAEAIRLLGAAGAELKDTPLGLRVTGTGTLKGFGDLDASQFPDASLCLAAVAAVAESPSHIYGLETLPLKESDRIEVMARSLAKAGCGVGASESDLRISPLNGSREPTVIDPIGDHRIAMAMAVLGTKRKGVSIVDPSCVTKSYPDFWIDLRKVYEGTDTT
ncbi:MAG: 3-phosphoshikimate 1-carboxyvinyltransferase [Phycisphaerales bacterium]|jgi:3-phosphoshikimate 1-carboxyvinyltransferase|nr:3-phosphoshikimate 1-carboxyvinyltransferase [Phycisphaerales bacterium]